MTPHPFEPRSTAHLSRLTRATYGFGSVSEGIKIAAFNTFLLFYFNQVLGLSGTLSGIAIFLALCVDAVTDPLVGSLSDNLHHRYGRRHPFMYASALPLGVSFWLLFTPPDGIGEYGLFAWFLTFAVLVRASYTLYSIPSNAMAAELTENYDERTTLVTWRWLFAMLGGGIFSQVAFRVFFVSTEAGVDGRLNADAYGNFAVSGALAMVLAIVACTAGTHRLIPSLHSPPVASPFSSRRFKTEITEVFRNRSYRMLVIGSLFSSVAGGFTGVVGLYVNTYFWGLSAVEIANLGIFMIIAVVLGLGLARPVTSAFGKRRVAVALSTFGIFFGPLLIYLRLLGLLPPNGHPAILPLIIIHAVIIATVVIIIGIAIGSMIADSADENELVTGKRQEGLFASAIAFTTKATSGIGGLLAGTALDLIEFPTQAASASVPPEKLFALGLAVGPVEMLLYLLSLSFLRNYRLTRARHSEILQELAARKRSE